MTSETVSGARVPTIEEMRTAIEAEIVALEERIKDRAADIDDLRAETKSDRERIGELKRMLPRKPRTRRTKAAPVAEAPESSQTAAE